MKRLAKKPQFVEGVIAQMFYVGAQIMVWTYIYQYAETLGIDNASAVNYAYTALILFLVGRWICTFLFRYFSPARLLLYFSILAICFTLGAIFTQGMLGLYSLVGISLAMSLDVSHHLWYCTWKASEKTGNTVQHFWLWR
jgi:MFS transporter, FHS family, L-fucose permease